MNIEDARLRRGITISRTSRSQIAQIVQIVEKTATKNHEKSQARYNSDVHGIQHCSWDWGWQPSIKPHYPSMRLFNSPTPSCYPSLNLLFSRAQASVKLSCPNPWLRHCDKYCISLYSWSSLHVTDSLTLRLKFENMPEFGMSRLSLSPNPLAYLSLWG